MHLLFGTLEDNGRCYGSDGKRSPLDRYHAPGSPEYAGPDCRQRQGCARRRLCQALADMHDSARRPGKEQRWLTHLFFFASGSVWGCAAFGLALLGASVGGLAPQAHAAELVASGPALCPDAEELTVRVERALGVDLESAVPLRFSVRFDGASPSGYRARLMVEPAEPTEPRYERVLSARDCEPLANAVAVAISLALGATEPEATAASANNPAGGEAASPLPASERMIAGDAERVSAPAAVSDIPRSRLGGSERMTLEPALALALVGDLGSLPGAGFGLALGTELRRGRLALRASGTLFLDRHVALPEGGDTELGADMSLALGSLSACTTPLGNPFGAAAFACAGWELGRLEAIGTGVQQPRRGGALWSAPRIDAGLGWPADEGALRLLAQVTIAAPLQRDEFYLRDLGTVHRPSAVAGRLSLGVELNFR
jgi:hypothetical protein